MSSHPAVRRPDPPPRDRIVVIAEPRAALDLLRLATLRSDDVLLVGGPIGTDARRYADRFAIDAAERPFAEPDLDGTAAILLALADVERENAVVRAARRRGVPVHVVGRPVVSDFTMLELLEGFASAARADLRLHAA